MEDDVETAVGIAGDWHGSAWWIGRAIPSIRRANPYVRTILHLGDLITTESTLRTIDYYAQVAGIERVLLTAGNHELWPQLDAALAANPGQPARLSNTVFVLPRPHRFEISGVSFLSLGGATSIDREDGVENVSWWESEVITDSMVDEAIAGGPADIMLTHETPLTTPVADVQRAFARNPLGLTSAELAMSKASRTQVQRVWDAVHPQMLMHGHLHIPGAGTTDDGRRVISFGCDDQRGNVELLDLATLELTPVEVRRQRDG